MLSFGIYSKYHFSQFSLSTKHISNSFTLLCSVCSPKLEKMHSKLCWLNCISNWIPKRRKWNRKVAQYKWVHWCNPPSFICIIIPSGLESHRAWKWEEVAIASVSAGKWWANGFSNETFPILYFIWMKNSAPSPFYLAKRNERERKNKEKWF